MKTDENGTWKTPTLLIFDFGLINVEARQKRAPELRPRHVLRLLLHFNSLFCCYFALSRLARVLGLRNNRRNLRFCYFLTLCSPSLPLQNVWVMYIDTRRKLRRRLARHRRPCYTSPQALARVSPLSFLRSLARSRPPPSTPHERRIGCDSFLESRTLPLPPDVLNLHWYKFSHSQ